MADDNFMYGIAAVKYKDFVVGYIEKGSFNINGKKPESADIDAEQVPGLPVLSIPLSNGSVEPSFNVIQLNYENLQKLLGGSLQYKKDDTDRTKAVGWVAPSKLIVISGPWELELVSGKSILIPSATLLSNLGGKLTLTETAKIECTLKVTQPPVGGPLGTFDTDCLPDEWKQYTLPPDPKESAQSSGE